MFGLSLPHAPTSLYANLLKALLYVTLPLEQKISDFLQHNPYALDYSFQPRHSLLIQDLIHLGVTIEYHYSPNTPEINCTSSLIGALYVLEGSAFGAELISRRIAAQQNSIELSFFTQTSCDWAAFTDLLNTMLLDEDKVIQTCQHCFSLFAEQLNQISSN